ncbi:MAG: C10 family peptidase [Bacteroides sp.]|nr:C10 family peptidase [Roseburia sp.]MCM1346816.1 C10 family peptidase [Bacteroides sp.]MCM1421370.1 C10 family peptidase [Bacteroides sp.]
MRRLLVLPIFAAAALTCHADPIDVSVARSVASRVLAASKGKAVETVSAEMDNEVKSRMAVSPVEAPAFYTFNAADGNGFVIVSGDDDFPAVIGYSDHGTISSAVEMPLALVDYLETYSRYVADVRSGQARKPDAGQMRFASSAPVVEPLCGSTWGQDDPFNAYCPLDNGKRSLVGCTATAMAQIMYKWKFPERARGTVLYNSGLGVINEDMSSDTHIYNWSAMKPTTAGNRLSSAKKAVAQLNYDCGITAKMEYSKDGSGAYEEDAMIAFRTNFCYNAQTLRLIFRDCFADVAAWNAVLYDELTAGRPVLFSASSLSGSGSDAAGHAFVIDGCDGEGLVHVNWGWNGSCDGYYDITRLDPKEEGYNTGYVFSESQTMVIGIAPGEGNEAVPQTRMVLEDAPAVEMSSVSLGAAFDLSVLSIYSRTLYKQTWTVGIGLFSKDGELLDVVSSVEDKANTFTLEGWYGYKQRTVRCTIPASFADGDYVLRVMTRQSGYEEWALPDVVGGDSRNWIPVYVASGTANFNKVSTSVNGVPADMGEVVSRHYTDLSGRRVAVPEKGRTVIEVLTLSGGKQVSVKRVF